MKIPKTLRWQSSGSTLGQGGQGQVVVVTDSTGELSGEFALKGLTKGKPAKAYERFAREVEAIKQLDCPSIIKIVDHSQPGDDFQYYVMEFHPDAESLKKLMASGRNPFAGDCIKATEFFVRLVEAFAHWEELGFAHRDLSPANVLVLPDETIKIIDFGLCQMPENEAITLTDEGVGTQNYMAPECEAGAPEGITSIADLYSIGKLLWSAITNKMAFARETSAYNDKSMPKEFPDLPEAWHLHHLFEGTVRHKPTDRFPSSSAAIKCARRVQHLVRAGHPPLEILMQGRCPSCGWGLLKSFEQSHMVFGNPNPSGIASLQCEYCGECFAVNRKGPKALLQSRASLS